MKNIQEKIRQYLKGRKNTISFFGSNQYQDWKIILSLTFLGVVGATCIGFWNYFNYDWQDQNDIVVSTFEKKLAVLKKVDNIVVLFGEKKKEYESLLVSPNAVSDPSI